MDETRRQYSFMDEARQYVAGEAARLGRPLTYHVTTFGCQMNARDSEKLSGILEMIGYLPGEEEEADLVLINTCTVRENANQRVYGRLGQLGGQKKRRPGMVIGICGCMMQEADEVERIRKTYRFVDLVFGTHNIFQLAELLVRRFRQREMVVDVWDGAKEIVEDLPAVRKYPFKSGVNIMFGCNNFCSYCIVPYVRGRERSPEPGDILREAERLAQDGVVEIMLLGQNVNSYGKTLGTPMSFAALLREMEKVEGIRRIRFMTSHPKDLSQELIQVMASSHKICRHLHLPLQSGSTRILQAMNRRYTKEGYLALVERIRAAMPDISLTTDIIAGFPGETEEDFEETLDVVRRVRYDSAFTFLYSKRTGTPAAAMDCQVDPRVAHRRFDRLLREVQDIAAQEARRYEGQTMEVLAEEVNRQQAGMLTGRLSNNFTVHFPADPSLIGKLVQVRLEKCCGFYYVGELA